MAVECTKDNVFAQYVSKIKCLGINATQMDNIEIIDDSVDPPPDQSIENTINLDYYIPLVPTITSNLSDLQSLAICKHSVSLIVLM